MNLQVIRVTSSKVKYLFKVRMFFGSVGIFGQPVGSKQAMFSLM